ncbi:MAG: poly-gamma-glutamate hydrolase family protein [Acidimicrobiales bacterium]|nr:poly-gamma-glutamate hydrolase family protein [Acidimicrobiales bacterium]
MDLAELLTLPGVREECVLRSNVGFMALHGGSQDRGTDQIASRAAEQAGASYYTVVQPAELRVHLTSRRHNPEHSALFRAFLRHVDISISVHGYGRDGFALWIDPDRGLVIEPYGPAIRGNQSGPLRGIILGGLNVDLLSAARQLLHKRFADYHVADGRVRLGFHPDNPVNLPSARGIQVELPPGLRGIGEFGEDPVPRHDGVVTEVVAALVELANRASELARTSPAP